MRSDGGPVGAGPSPAATSFDCFGTLVAVDRPADPAAEVADELAGRGVAVPDDWADAFAEYHVEVPPGAELSLVEHATAALSSRSVAFDRKTVEAAVLAAFDAEVWTRDGAAGAVEAAAARGPVGVLSNCSVPGLVERVLAESAIDADRFDAVVTSVGCGWRKPDRRAFAAVADALGVDLDGLVHVGDDADADGGAEAAGASSVLVEETPLPELADHLEHEGDGAPAADPGGRPEDDRWR